MSSFYPPHLSYVVVGEEDTNASPVAPPGSRVLVNKLLTKVQPAENVSFHERELFYVLTPNGLTCVYAELVHGNKIMLIPHPASGNLREEFNRDEVTIIGQVVGVLYPSAIIRDRKQLPTTFSRPTYVISIICVTFSVREPSAFHSTDILNRFLFGI